MNLRHIPRDLIAPRPALEPASAPDSQTGPADPGAFENALLQNHPARAEVAPREFVDSSEVDSDKPSDNVRDGGIEVREQPVRSTLQSREAFDPQASDSSPPVDSSHLNEAAAIAAGEQSAGNAATSEPVEDSAGETSFTDPEVAAQSDGVRSVLPAIPQSRQQVSPQASELAPENTALDQSTLESPPASVLPLRRSQERQPRGSFRRIDAGHRSPSNDRNRSETPVENNGQLLPLQSLLPSTRSVDRPAGDDSSLRFPAQVDLAFDSTLARSTPLKGLVPDLPSSAPEISETDLAPASLVPLPSLIALDSESGAKSQSGVPRDAIRIPAGLAVSDLLHGDEPELTLLIPDSPEVQVTSTEATLPGGVAGAPHIEVLEPLPSLLRTVEEVAPSQSQVPSRSLKPDSAAPAGHVSAIPDPFAVKPVEGTDSTFRNQKAVSTTQSERSGAIPDPAADPEALGDEAPTGAAELAAFSQSQVAALQIPPITGPASSALPSEDRRSRSGTATAAQIVRAGEFSGTSYSVPPAQTSRPDSASEPEGVAVTLDSIRPRSAIEPAGSALPDDILPVGSDRAAAVASEVTSGREAAAAGVVQTVRAEPGPIAYAADLSDGATAADDGLMQIELSETVSTIRRAISGDGHIKVRLNPPELGAMQIEVRQVDASITVRLEVETEAAQKALLESLGDLRQSLRQQRAGVEQIDVVLIERSQEPLRGSLDDGRRDADRERSSEEQNRRQEQERRNRQQRRSSNPDEEASSEAA